MRPRKTHLRMLITWLWVKFNGIPLVLEPILVVIGMFTGVRVLTHGHMYSKVARGTSWILVEVASFGMVACQKHHGFLRLKDGLCFSWCLARRLFRSFLSWSTSLISGWAFSRIPAAVKQLSADLEESNPNHAVSGSILQEILFGKKARCKTKRNHPLGFFGEFCLDVRTLTFAN